MHHHCLLESTTFRGETGDPVLDRAHREVVFWQVSENPCRHFVLTLLQAPARWLNLFSTCERLPSEALRKVLRQLLIVLDPAGAVGEGYLRTYHVRLAQYVLDFGRPAYPLAAVAGFLDAYRAGLDLGLTLPERLAMRLFEKWLASAHLPEEAGEVPAAVKRLITARFKLRAIAQRVQQDD